MKDKNIIGLLIIGSCLVATHVFLGKRFLELEKQCGCLCDDSFCKDL